MDTPKERNNTLQAVKEMIPEADATPKAIPLIALPSLGSDFRAIPDPIKELASSTTTATDPTFNFSNPKT